MKGSKPDANRGLVYALISSGVENLVLQLLHI
jgi:hypothetical protein